MFHAVVIAVFVVDYQGIIGVPSLQAQRFILAGYDLREQLLKNAGSSCGRWYSLWIYVGMEILPLVESDWLDLPPQ